MIPPLFSKDNQSVDDVSFCRVNEPIRDTILNSLTFLYPEVALDQAAEPLQIGTTNINSLNFRLGDYYIKILDRRSLPAHFELLPDLSHHLRAQGIPCARYVLNRMGAFWSPILTDAIIATREPVMLVQEFLPGDYCSGALCEIIAIKETLSRFHLAIAHPPRPQLFARPFSDWNPLREIADLRDVVSAKKELTEFDALVLSNLDPIEAVALRCDPLLQSNKRMALQHIDVHPLNILMRDGNVAALLDFDMLVYAPAGLGEAFSTFKICRKAVAAGLLGTLEVAQSISFSAADVMLTQLELLRRLILILNLYFGQGDGRWNRDFTKHLCALHEVEALFGACSRLSTEIPGTVRDVISSEAAPSDGMFTNAAKA